MFSISYTCYAQWISLDKTSVPGSKPIVKLISDSPSETILKINLPGFYVREFSADGKTYQKIDIGDQGISSETGFPDLPDIAKVLAIPDNGTAQIEVIETSPVQKIEGINTPPVRESWIEGKPETPYLENAGCYSSEKIYPEKLAAIEDPAIFRDFRIARVSVFPLRYIPSKNEIEAVSSITVRVRYLSGIGLNPKTTPHRPIAPSFGRLYRGFIFNYNEVLQREYGGRENGQELMLCIMPDIFYNSFLPYADWKQKSGTMVHITKFSDIGANSSDPTIIKSYITACYTNWITPPTHVLIVGDYGVAPVQFVSYDWTFVNEDYFVELEGDDYFPELLIGRFTNQTDYQLQTIINKDINYERFPYVTDGSWYKRATVCANNSYESQVETKRFAAAELTEYGSFVVDTLMSDDGCSMDLSDVIATINNGISFLNYRGEGWTDGWHANCYYFSTSDVAGLNNAAKLTFVTSIGCGVAQFSDGESFGEKWLELGTPTAPRGACAFLGPTSNTHTAYNNEIDKGIYIGMFQEGIDSPAEALLRGKLYMYQVFGNVYRVEYHYRIYCELGDPSLHVWKNIPKPVTVTFPSTIPSGYSQPEVIVKYTETGNPVALARLCISEGNINVVANTNLSGVAYLDVNAAEGDTLNVTVCGGTVYPFVGTIIVIPAVENVAPLQNPITTDLDGDQDGLLDPNENCTIAYTLKNWGNTTSDNITAILSLPDSVTNVDIITDTVSYGNIASGDSILGSPFQFYIHPDCPVGFEIPFKLHVVSSTSSWDYYTTEIVHGCNLKYTQYLIDDSGNLLHNDRMDPGETVNVILKIQNTGDDIAPNIKGILRCSDQYISILDSVGNFGALSPDSSITNDEDVFVVKVSDNCPVQYDVSYLIKLITQNGTYPYTSIQSFFIPVAQPSGSDPTGPDQYGYYALSVDDTLWRQSPSYNWIDITTEGTQLTVPPNHSDYTQAVNLPFTFKYYGTEYDQVRISTDGWIAFGSGNQTNSVNHALPYVDDVNNMVAAFWDDLFQANGEPGKILYYNNDANHRFIISWNQVTHADNSNNKETFQIILFNPAFYPTTTGDGDIIVQYKTVEEPGSCAVGIENSNQDVGLTYLNDENYNITATQILDNFAIKFTTMTPVVVSVDGNNDNKLIPDKFSLAQNFPNPFNPTTTIRYDIPKASYVTLKIYRIDGQLVRTLQDDYRPAGIYELIWDGRNDHGLK